jgi:hypothetical protein
MRWATRARWCCWQVTGVVVLGGERITLPGNESWIALDQDALRVTHSAGLVTFVETRGPAVRARATDGAGQTLPLQQAAGSEPINELTMALTEDRYFAVPQAHLVVRLAEPPGQPSEAHGSVLVQVYHSPPGR